MAQKNSPAATPSPYRSFYAVLVLVALVGAGALTYTVLRARAGGRAALEPVQIRDTANLRAIFERATPVTLGSAGAPVKIVEFGDYMCPYCGEWSAQVQPRILQDYVQTGKAQLIYYDYPLSEIHKHSFVAARAGRCAGEQGKFWEMHDALFGHQAEWSFQESAPVKAFEGYAGSIGLDQRKFSACLESNRFADVVTYNHMLGRQLGVEGTPTIIVNEQRLSEATMGLRDYGALRKVLDAAAGAGPAAPPSAGAAPATGAGARGS